MEAAGASEAPENLWEIVRASAYLRELLIWELLGISGTHWEPQELLGASGSLWEPLEAFGSFWKLLGTSTSGSF